MLVPRSRDDKDRVGLELGGLVVERWNHWVAAGKGPQVGGGRPPWKALIELANLVGQAR